MRFCPLHRGLIRHNPNMSEPNHYSRIALAACFGTFIEWYDFLTFATLAVHFAAVFFPADDPVAGLLYSPKMKNVWW